MALIREAWLNYRWHLIFGMVLMLPCAWLAYMAADNQPPYEYDALNSRVVPSPAHDGDQITVKWKLAKVNRVCPGSNRRVLFDPKTRVILASYDPTPAAISSNIEDGYLNRTFMLPRGLLPASDIGYRATVCYSCNLLQEFRPLCVSTPELIFRIEP